MREKSVLFRLPLLLLIMAVACFVTYLVTSDRSPKIIDVNVTAAGCYPSNLAMPTGSLTIQASNQSGVGGEFEIKNENSTSLYDRSLQVNQTRDIPVKLKTGYYTIDCGSDASTARLIVGVPSEPPLNLGSIPAPNNAPVSGYSAKDGNSFTSTNLIASDASYDAQITDPDMIDAWGLASRPPGDGGHFWIAANKTGTSLEYSGDVNNIPLNQQNLSVISIPDALNQNPNLPIGVTQRGRPTGVVFNANANAFDVNQGAISGSAKFIFASQDGTLSAWTEQPNTNGSVTQLAWATKVSDQSKQYAQYFGLAIAPSGNQLLAADFGVNPQIRTFDSSFNLISTTGFSNPFVKNNSSILQPGNYYPWNVTTIGDKVYVSYVKLAAVEHQPSQPSIGEEQHGVGYGRVVEYNADGSMVKILNDKGSLDAPWGITVAPSGFGKLSGDLLVGNFGDGSIAAFDSSGNFVDWVRQSDNKVLVVPGVWALVPGNGDTLGQANAVYFTAGPDNEQAGIFGRIKVN